VPRPRQGRLPQGAGRVAADRWGGGQAGIIVRRRRHLRYLIPHACSPIRSTTYLAFDHVTASATAHRAPTISMPPGSSSGRCMKRCLLRTRSSPPRTPHSHYKGGMHGGASDDREICAGRSCPSRRAPPRGAPRCEMRYALGGNLLDFCASPCRAAALKQGRSNLFPPLKRIESLSRLLNSDHASCIPASIRDFPMSV
jgi:hypothetical protein